MPRIPQNQLNIEQRISALIQYCTENGIPIFISAITGIDERGKAIQKTSCISPEVLNIRCGYNNFPDLINVANGAKARYIDDADEVVMEIKSNSEVEEMSDSESMKKMQEMMEEKEKEE